MNITIKNLKVAEFASEETLCFEATVYVDGKRAFIASNDGHGGCNFYHPIKGQDRDAFKTVLAAAEKYAAAKCTEFDFEQLDCLIGDLIDDVETERAVKKNLSKQIVADVDGKILCWNKKGKGIPAAQVGKYTEMLREGIAKKHPTAVILNDMPLPKAMEVYKNAGLI